MSRARWLGVAVVVVVALLAGRYLTSVSVQPISYWVIDDRTLGVMVVGGAGDTCSVIRTEETTDEVRVVAECREPFLMLGRPAIGIPHDFVVALDQPLDGRRVVDGLGHPAEHCAEARCGRPA